MFAKRKEGALEEALSMAIIEVDIGLNKHLGLPEDYPLDKKDAFKLYRYFNSLFESTSPVGTWIMQFYAEKHGDFFNDPKTEQDRIVRDIVLNMSMSDQYIVQTDLQVYMENFRT